MLVIPAIDLYEGRVVRFEKGRKENCRFYELDPIELLETFVWEGFKLVHVVDLSAAIDGSRSNEAVLKKIASKDLARFVQLGGGIRDVERALKLKEMGFERQILSSALVENPSLVRELLARGVDVIFSLDTSQGKVRVKGWNGQSDVDAIELLERLKNFGLRRVVHTDVDADGTMKGRDLRFTRKLAIETEIEFIVAGGAGSVEDLKRVRELSFEVPNVVGLIVGRAFYEGKISLEVMRSYV